MEKSKMKNKGKKIVAVALSLAMMLPLTFSQTATTGAATTTTKASSTTTQAATANESAYLQLKNTEASVSLEKGDEFTLALQAKAQFNNTEAITGEFCYSENGTEGKYFEITRVEPTASGWATYYDNSTGKFGITRGQGLYTSGAAGSEIAKITFRVIQAVDKADIVLKLSKFSGYVITTSSGNSTTSTFTEDENDSTGDYHTVSVNLDNKNKTRTVTLSNEKDIKVKVPQNSNQIKEFQVPVEITQNSGFSGIQLKVSFTGNLMSYEGYEIVPKMRTYLPSVTEKTETVGTQTDIYISMSGEDDMKLKGQFIIFKFKPTMTAQGQTINLNFSVEKIVNSSNKVPIANFSNATSTVSFVQGSDKGDVNCDGNITLIDVTYALQAYNNVRELTEEEFDNADVNDDDKLTLVDVLLILKKVNGESVNF